MSDDAIERARARWPGVTVDPARFTAHVAGAALDELVVEDLYLACACADGDPVAIAAFDAEFSPVIARAIAAAGIAPGDRNDVAQITRARILVARTGEPPRIATYRGQARLEGWVRVVAAREASRWTERKQPQLPDSDVLAAELAPDDTELAYLRRLGTAAFKHAFEEAVADLDPPMRLLLFQNLVDGLGIDQLAALHDVHRATAARWIERARAHVMTSTVARLRRHLALDPEELDGLLRLIRSQLDLSLRRVLGRW